MPSTYLSLHYHVVFSTKDRRPLIAKPWRAQFHQYIGGTLRGLDAIPESVGGVADHVHILMGLRATHRIADLMRELKKATSVWASAKTNATGGRVSFAWQEGYAAFTVSATARPDVRAYIENQEEHHRAKTFREELVTMLERAGVDYRPEYLD